MKDDRFILLLLLVMLFTGFVVLVCTGCKVHKHGTTEYEYNGQDYTTTIHVHDTTYIEKIASVDDTVVNEKEVESNTGISFVYGGGTYNVKTGEATGVAKVSVSEKEKQLQSEISKLHAEEKISARRIQTLKDSLAVYHEQMKQETQTESKAQNYWWVWLLVGLAVGAGGIIALKKIPYTRPLMFWL